VNENVTGGRIFRVGITPDFATEAKGLLEPTLVQILGPAQGVEWEVMPDTTGVAVADVLDRYDAVIVLDYHFTAESFRGVKRLAIIARWGVGYDRIDVAASTEADVILAIAPDAVRRAVAEGAVALILALAKNLRTMDRNCRAGLWREQIPQGINIEGRTLGSVGLGNIGRELFHLGRGLGFSRFLAYSPRGPQFGEAYVGTEFTDLETVMRESDFVTINCPLNEGTRGLIGARQLALMKPTAYLINTSRGAVVDQAALVAALREQRIAGAGIDVFENEPALAGHPLFELENVVLCPHSIARTQECTRDTSISACQSVLDVFRGNAPRYVVNESVLSRPGMREKLSRLQS
jgi:phosphoglycerate dehydrogenase-like enzyme